MFATTALLRPGFGAALSRTLAAPLLNLGRAVPGSDPGVLGFNTPARHAPVRNAHLLVARDNEHVGLELNRRETRLLADAQKTPFDLGRRALLQGEVTLNHDGDASSPPTGEGATNSNPTRNALPKGMIPFHQYQDTIDLGTFGPEEIAVVAQVTAEFAKEQHTPLGRAVANAAQQWSPAQLDKFIRTGEAPKGAPNSLDFQKALISALAEHLSGNKFGLDGVQSAADLAELLDTDRPGLNAFLSTVDLAKTPEQLAEVVAMHFGPGPGGKVAFTPSTPPEQSTLQGAKL